MLQDKSLACLLAGVFATSAWIGGCFVGGDGGDGEACLLVAGHKVCAEIELNAAVKATHCECLSMGSFSAFEDPNHFLHDSVVGQLVDGAIVECTTVATQEQLPLTSCVETAVTWADGGPCLLEVCEEGDDEVGDEAGNGAPPPSYGIASFAEVITCYGSDCTVQADFVDSLVADPLVLFDDPARLTPDTTATGQPGLRVSGVTGSSLASALGVQDGELVLSINGLPLGGPADAAAAVAALAGTTRFEVEVADARDRIRVLRVSLE